MESKLLLLGEPTEGLPVATAALKARQKVCAEVYRALFTKAPRQAAQMALKTCGSSDLQAVFLSQSQTTASRIPSDANHFAFVQ